MSSASFAGRARSRSGSDEGGVRNHGCTVGIEAESEGDGEGEGDGMGERALARVVIACEGAALEPEFEAFSELAGSTDLRISVMVGFRADSIVGS